MSENFFAAYRERYPQSGVVPLIRKRLDDTANMEQTIAELREYAEDVRGTSRGHWLTDRHIFSPLFSDYHTYSRIDVVNLTMILIAAGILTRELVSEGSTEGSWVYLLMKEKNLETVRLFRNLGVDCSAKALSGCYPLDILGIRYLRGYVEVADLPGWMEVLSSEGNIGQIRDFRYVRDKIQVFGMPPAWAMNRLFSAGFYFKTPLGWKIKGRRTNEDPA